MWAQVGAGISPFIAESFSVYWQPLPATIFSATCFAAGLVIVLFFPNVEHAVLPDTLNDTELEAIERDAALAEATGSSSAQQQAAAEAGEVVRHRRVTHKLKKSTAAPA